jgi:hypothetical protein
MIDSDYVRPEPTKISVRHALQLYWKWNFSTVFALMTITVIPILFT